MLCSVYLLRFKPLPYNPFFLRPWVKSFLKTLRKKEKMLVTSILSFSHNVFQPYPIKNNRFLELLFLPSNASGLDQSKILSFGKALTGIEHNSCLCYLMIAIISTTHFHSRFLTHSLIHHFETVPNSKNLQTTSEMWLLKDFKIQIT